MYQTTPSRSLDSSLESQRAERERIRAEKLAEKLRSLGVNLDDDI